MTTGQPSLWSVTHTPLTPDTVLPQSAAAAPLVARGEVIGVCCFYAAEPRRFLADDMDLVREVANHIAYAMDNQRLYHEAKNAIAARDTFLSIASHELKTPLTALQLQTQSLHRMYEHAQIDEQVRLRKKVDVIGNQVNRMNNLVTRLLDISRIAVDRMEIDYERTNLTELINNLVPQFAEGADGPRPHLDFTGPPALWGLWDSGRIEQVLVNLISNAVKFGGGKPVHITLEERAGHAHVCVQDHGLGIPQQDQARIFERFERAVSARHYGGFGLGLWICRQLVEAHGGRITVNSKPNEGSAFEIDLPLAPTGLS